MKSTIILLLLFPLSIGVFAQKSRVTVMTEDADITLNGLLVGKTIKLNEENNTGFVVVAKKGFVTYGDKNEEIIKKGETSTITLSPVKKPAAGMKSRKIEFGMFVSTSGKELDHASYSKPVSKLMAEWGYAMIEVNNMFGVKDDAPDLVLAGEILNTGSDNRGSGFQASIIINWSLLDVETKKIVYTGVTGGFSDSKKVIGWNEEFTLSLKDATVSLMSDPKFQAVTLQTPESSGSDKTGVVTTLPLIAAGKYAGYSDMVKNTVGSVVTIKNGNSFGSGFLISKSGYLITNNHVVAGGDKLEIIFSNGMSLEGTTVKTDGNRDVALVKISGGGFVPLAMGSAMDELEIGTEVIAIGTPEDIKLNQTVTKGIVSGKRELEDEYNRKNKFIQTDVTINRGNSGGPLLNMKGEVVGVIVAKMDGKNTEGLGFAIPIGEAIEKLNVKFQ